MRVRVAFASTCDGGVPLLVEERYRAKLSFEHSPDGSADDVRWQFVRASVLTAPGATLKVGCGMESPAGDG